MSISPTALTGANVRAEMARRNISQVTLAAAMKMSQPALSKRLRGITPFDVNEITEVAAYLGVTVGDLLSLEPAA
jgi:transcriptional regulator with XRE-family HTH domain